MNRYTFGIQNFSTNGQLFPNGILAIPILKSLFALDVIPAQSNK